MKEWRSGEQREINNRAKCEDHGHSFQQTLLKTVQVRGRGEWDRSRPLRPGTAQVRHQCVCVCVCLCVCVCVCVRVHVQLSLNCT